MDVTISIPGTFALVGTGPSGALAVGRDVGDPLDDLASNNSQLYGGMVGHIGASMYGVGWTTASASWQDYAVYRRPAHLDTRACVIYVRAKHSGAGGDATLRIIDGATTATVAVPAAAPSASQYAITWTPPDSSAGTIILQGDSTALTIYSATVGWALLTGPVSDTPKASGWLWAQPANQASAEPVRDEWINRLLRNPRKLYLAQPHCVGCITDAPTSGRLGIASSNTSPQGWTFAAIRHEVTVRAWVLAIHTGSTGTVNVNIGGAAGLSASIPTASLPSPGGTYTWADAGEARLSPGVYRVGLDVIDATVYTVQLLTEPA